MKKKVKFYVSKNGLNKAINFLDDYKKQINDKTKLFIDFLSDYGKVTIEDNIQSSGELNDIGYVTHMIQVEKTLEHPINGYKAIIYAFDVDKVISIWYNSKGRNEAEVSPLLMMEFGSGQMAENPLNVGGVGQGTFPGQTHADQPQGWYWRDEDGNLYHSKGIVPTQPMYHAQQKLLQDLERIAKEVFK